MAALSRVVNNLINARVGVELAKARNTSDVMFSNNNMSFKYDDRFRLELL